MTNNPPSECRPSKHWVLSCEQWIIALRKVRKVKKSKCPRTQEYCFLPSGNNTSTTLEVSVTPPEY
jgi:hypothetical protein